MDFTFPPCAVTAVPVADGQHFFPVHRIYCVGQNYSDHAKEMGGSGRDAPFFFMKPADAVWPVAHGTTGSLPYPAMTGNFHHEVELVVAIGQGGKNIAAGDARRHVWGYAVGLDMTRRDLQAEAKKSGRPWSTAKGFDRSAPIAPIHPIAETGWMTSGAIRLAVNGTARQMGDVDQMIWNVAETIEHLSRFFELQPGDLTFTGTPAGVAALEKGDLIEATIAGLGGLTVRVT